MAIQTSLVARAIDRIVDAHGVPYTTAAVLGLPTALARAGLEPEDVDAHVVNEAHLHHRRAVGIDLNAAYINDNAIPTVEATIAARLGGRALKRKALTPAERAGGFGLLGASHDGEEATEG